MESTHTHTHTERQPCAAVVGKQRNRNCCNATFSLRFFFCRYMHVHQVQLSLCVCVCLLVYLSHKLNKCCLSNIAAQIRPESKTLEEVAPVAHLNSVCDWWAQVSWHVASSFPHLHPLPCPCPCHCCHCYCCCCKTLVARWQLPGGMKRLSSVINTSCTWLC